MKEIFKYIPGFRTNTKWKKIIASIYYVVCLATLSTGIGAFIFYLA